MKVLDFALRQGWSSLWRSRGGSASAIVAIALAMIVLGALLLATWNAQRLVDSWTSAAEFSVYLRDDATSEQRGAIEQVIDQSGAAAAREYVSKAQALARFRRDFAELASLASSIEDNPFPASLEVRLRPGADANGRVDALVGQIAALPGVADVGYDRAWIARFSAAVRTTRAAGFGLAALMALAAGVTVAAVVRLGLHARRDEIEIMTLVGSPLAFIRGPFVAEGVMQGGIGALLALVVLWGGFAAARAWWGAELASLLGGSTVAFLPAGLCLWLVLGGMTVGAAGGFAASRHAG